MIPGIRQGGFTLIEILISLGVLAIVTGSILFFINPTEQFAKTRNTERAGDITNLLNAIGSRIADNGGAWNATCGASTTTLPSATTTIGTSYVNLDPCLVPAYLSSVPFDPQTGNAADTKYQIFRNATTGRITISASGAELGESLSVTR